MKLKTLLTAGLVTALITVTAHAEWVVIEDFEGSAYEDFNLYKRFAPQGDMYLIGLDPTNPSNGHYYVDPGPQVDGGNNQVWNGITLPTPIADGAKTTLKYRVYFYESGPFNLNIGFSDVPVVLDDTLSKDNGQMLEPSSYRTFESQCGLTDKGIITVRNGNGFSDTVVPIPVGEWITIYHLIDNGSDTTQFYYKLESMSEPAIIELVDGSNTALFRNGTSDPLVTFTMVSAGSNSGPVNVFLVDDITYDPTGFNLDGGTPVEGDKFWGGYKVVNDAGDVDTGNWMGWISVAQAPYIFSYSLGWIYMEEPAGNVPGSWGYFFK